MTASSIESGDWVVPQVGGELYFKKPPLVNWSIALSISATGKLTEWSARLPSAISVLLLGLGVWFLARRALPPAGALLAGAFVMTNIGLLEKGRLAEIDALYILWFGLAWAVWVFPASGCRTWTNWLLAGVWLGAGMLTKGPLPLLLFFYAFVVARLWADGELRRLGNWEHALLLLAAFGPFIAWSLAHSARIGPERPGDVWTAELMTRLLPERFRGWRYVEGFPRGIFNYLPWAALLPLLWWRPLLSKLPEREGRRFRATRLALVLSYLAVAVLPDSRPRYNLPLLVPASVLLAQALALGVPSSVQQRHWPRGLRVAAGATILAAVAGVIANGLSLQNLLLAVAAAAGGVWLFRAVVGCTGAYSLSVATVGATVLLGGLFVAFVVPVIDRKGGRERAKAVELARQIPEEATLFAVRLESQPPLFYLGWRVTYLGSLQALPARRPLHVLVREETDKASLRETPGATNVWSFIGYQSRAVELWRLDRADVP